MTGVQTCALPIWRHLSHFSGAPSSHPPFYLLFSRDPAARAVHRLFPRRVARSSLFSTLPSRPTPRAGRQPTIGFGHTPASCPSSARFPHLRGGGPSPPVWPRAIPDPRNLYWKDWTNPPPPPFLRPSLLLGQAVTPRCTGVVPPRAIPTPPSFLGRIAAFQLLINLSLHHRASPSRVLPTRIPPLAVFFFHGQLPIPSSP